MKTKYKYLILIIVTILASIFIYNFIEENTNVKTKKSISEAQANIEKEITSNTNYSINNPKVIINPYGISPLTALIIFKTNDLAAVDITIKGKNDNDITNTFIPSKVHYIPIYGLYPDYENTIIISASGEKKTIKIKTDKLPNNIKEAKAFENESDEFYFTTSQDNNNYPIAYDKYGNVRWFLNKAYSWDFTRLSNGYILLGNNELMKDPYYSTGLVEMDLLGKIYYQYNLPGGYHHDVYEMTNGNLIAISNDFSSKTKEDYIAIIDRTNGKIIKSFYLSKLLDNKKEGNWISLNSVAYDYDTNSIITVGNKEDMIINIDYNTGEINWIIADKNRINNKYHKYLLDIDGEIEYPTNPSSVVLKDGKLAYINNKNGNNHLVIYKVDTSLRTVKEENNIDLGKSTNNANLDIDGGNYLVTMGSNIKKINNDEVTDIMRTNNDIYSAKNTKMYAGDIFMIGQMVSYGSTGITPTTKDEPLLIYKKDDTVFKHYNLNLSRNSNFLVVKGTFKKTDKVQIILDNVLSKKTYNVDVLSGNETISGKMDTSTYISKEGVYGKYYIYLKVNSTTYKLSKYVMMS